MDHMRDEFAGSLSGGQRKLLEMARGLMVEPAMIMLDEPMAGVNPALTQSLLGHVKDLRDKEGRTVVFVEHDMDVVYDIRSEEHTSELQSLMRTPNAVFCLKKKNKNNNTTR